MIGREHELEQLGQVLERAKDGQGGLFLLAGEAGVGKTRLADAAVAAAQLAPLRGVAAAARRCRPTRPSPPRFAGSSAVIPRGSRVRSHSPRISPLSSRSSALPRSRRIVRL